MDRRARERELDRIEWEQDRLNRGLPEDGGGLGPENS